MTSHFNFYPSIDLFASRLNFKVKRFYSHVPDPQSAGTDAFSLQWPSAVYAFPPVDLIHKFLATFSQLDLHEGLLICPFWPSQPYFPSLLHLLIDSPVLFSVSRLEGANILPRHMSTFLASHISTNQDQIRAFRAQLSSCSYGASTLIPYVSTYASEKCLPIGYLQDRCVTATLI